MKKIMTVFISMRCTLCGHFLQVALTLLLVVGYAIAARQIACKLRGLMVTGCASQFATLSTLFLVLVGCGLLMLKVSRLKLPVIWLLVSMWLNTLIFFSSRRRHTRYIGDWSSDVCSSDLGSRVFLREQGAIRITSVSGLQMFALALAAAGSLSSRSAGCSEGSGPCPAFGQFCRKN